MCHGVAFFEMSQGPFNRHRRRICFPINYNLIFEVIIVATEYKGIKTVFPFEKKF